MARAVALTFALFAAQLTAACLRAASAAPTVHVDGGEVSGKPWKGSILFRGIPFAAPPLGELRWKPPRPPVTWEGLRASLEQPSSCVQPDQGWNHADFLIGNEDCLTLDVRTPSMTGRLPVLVWIHGGSNRAGGPNDIILSDVGQQVVIVGVRYRLGIFGFLSRRDLSAEQGGTSGNYGLMDQVAALQWVHRNIAKFGGDPHNVTIAGESAGSEDVSLMLAAPAARSLFQKAIMESGTPGFGLPFRSLADAERIGDRADMLLGAGGDLAKLRAVPAKDLLAADAKLSDPGAPDDSFLWLRITVDGRALPANPRRLLAAAPPRPVILGSNRFEFGLGGGLPERDRLIATSFGANAVKAHAYYHLDQPAGPPDPRFGSRDGQIATDIIFRCPAAHFARIMTSKGAPVWQYEFDAAPGGGRTSHAAEIAYAFGGAKLANGLSLTPYWLNFIRRGDPNGVGLPAWPKFTPARARELTFSDGAVLAGDPIHPRVCALLDDL